MSAQHTPGPWTVTPVTDCWYEPKRIFSGDRQVAEVYGATEVYSERVTVRSANARLIAAAPDLLAKVREAVVILEGFPLPSAWVGNARAVIAKVAGEAP